MRVARLIVAALALGLSGQVLAQGVAKPKPTAQTPAAKAPASKAATPAPSAPADAAANKAKIDDAAYEMRVLVSALQSDKVEAPVKDVLFGCIYSNAFSKISDSIGKVIAENPGKVDKRNPDQVLLVMAGVCGYRPAKPAAAPSAPAAPKPPVTPAPPSSAPVVR